MEKTRTSLNTRITETKPKNNNPEHGTGNQGLLGYKDLVSSIRNGSVSVSTRYIKGQRKEELHGGGKEEQRTGDSGW